MKTVEDLATQMKGDQVPPNPIEIVSMFMQPVESTIESKQQEASILEDFIFNFLDNCRLLFG